MTLNESLSLPERLRLRALVFGESVTAKLLREAADEIQALQEQSDGWEAACDTAHDALLALGAELVRLEQS